MGLLDWLTDGIGSDMGGGTPMQPGPGSQMGGMDPMGNPTGQSMPLPTPAPAPTLPMPPVQQTGPDLPYPPGVDPMTAGGQPPNGPGLPYAPGTDPMTAGGAPPNGPGLPPPPLPVARPPGANAPPQLGPPPPLPPPGNGTNGVGPGLGVAAPPAGFSAPSGAPATGGAGFIGRALGLDANKERSMFGSIGAGLTAAGNSKGKAKGQAFASGAGASIEGGLKTDKETTDQQSKYLNDAIKAKQAGDVGALNVARTRLALSQAKAAESGKDTKASVMNSQEQLYLRGLSAVNQDGKVKASLANLRSIQTQFGADSKEAKAAMASHNDLIAGTKKQVFATLGVNEKDAEKIGKQPGFAADNPVPSAGLTKEKFDALPPGSYFINPKDNQLLIKQPPQQQAAGASPTPQAQSPTPAAPVPVTAPAGSPADQDQDE